MFLLDKKLEYKSVTCCSTDNCNGAMSSPKLITGMQGEHGIISTAKAILFSSVLVIMLG